MNSTYSKVDGSSVTPTMACRQVRTCYGTRVYHRTRCCHNSYLCSSFVIRARGRGVSEYRSSPSETNVHPYYLQYIHLFMYFTNNSFWLIQTHYLLHLRRNSFCSSIIRIKPKSNWVLFRNNFPMGYLYNKTFF